MFRMQICGCLFSLLSVGELVLTSASSDSQGDTPATTNDVSFLQQSLEIQERARASAVDRYVSTISSDENSGTTDVSFASLQQCVDVSESGDGSYVLGGSYHEEVLIQGKSGSVIAEHGDEEAPFDGKYLEPVGLLLACGGKPCDVLVQSREEETARPAVPLRTGSSVSTFGGVFLKLFTSMVFIDGMLRFLAPRQHETIADPIDVKIPGTSPRQRMLLPGMVALFVILALFGYDSELRVTVIGGGLYLMVKALVTYGTEQIAKTFVAEIDADGAKAEDEVAEEIDAGGPKAEHEVADQRLRVSGLPHDSDEYVPLWILAPEVWAKKMDEVYPHVDDEDED